MKTEHLAEICHEAHKAYWNTLADTQMTPWAITRPEVKLDYIRSVAFLLEHPGKSPRQAHEAWVKKMKAAGWTHAPVGDPEKKQHPLLLSYDGLEPRQQFCLEVTRAIVDAARPYLRASPAAPPDRPPSGLPTFLTEIQRQRREIAQYFVDVESWNDNRGKIEGRIEPDRDGLMARTDARLKALEDQVQGQLRSVPGTTPQAA